MNYIVDQVFEKVKFNEKALAKGEYENCTFKHCDFSNTDLSEINFAEVEFIACNLSLTKLYKTAFRNVIFKECKMLGMHFENCHTFGLSFSFENCQLNHSSFYKTKIKNTRIRNAALLDVDFTECDLSGSIIQNCDLKGSIFDNTNLEKADFRTSFNYVINPEINKIRKAKFSLSDISGLLESWDIEIDSNI